MYYGNRLDFQTLGSRPIMPKNLPDYWSIAMNGENRPLVTHEPVEVEK